MRSTDRSHAIRAVNFGPEPYLSVSPTDNNRHLLGPNPESGTKTKLISSYLYVRSLPSRHVAFSSLTQNGQKEYEKVDNGQEDAVPVHVTEDEIGRISESEDECRHPTHDAHLVISDQAFPPNPGNAMNILMS